MVQVILADFKVITMNKKLVFYIFTKAILFSATIRELCQGTLTRFELCVQSFTRSSRLFPSYAYSCIRFSVLKMTLHEAVNGIVQ